MLQRITQSRTVITVMGLGEYLALQSTGDLHFSTNSVLITGSNGSPIYVTGSVPNIHEGNGVLCLALGMET